LLGSNFRFSQHGGWNIDVSPGVHTLHDEVNVEFGVGFAQVMANGTEESITIQLVHSPEFVHLVLLNRREVLVSEVRNNACSDFSKAFPFGGDPFGLPSVTPEPTQSFRLTRMLQICQG
jgi:hypothetical protein